MVTLRTSQRADHLQLVSDFVNTAVLGTGAHETFSTPERLKAWLTSHQLLSHDALMSEADRVEAVTFREHLRGFLFAKHEDEGHPQSVGALNAMVKKAAVSPVFTSPFRVEFQPTSPGVHGALGRLLGIIVRATMDGSWAHVRACQNTTCKMAFVDDSRNHSRAWCDMAICGNRVKARRFRLRHPRRPPPPIR